METKYEEGPLVKPC